MTNTNRKPNVPAEVEAVIDNAADEFDAAIERGDFEAAEIAARASWDAIPEPKSQWDYYPDVLPRDYADLFVRAGDVEHAASWLAIAMGSRPIQVGENVPLQRVAARVRAAMGDRETAEMIAGTLLERYGKRPFSGDDSDLLPLAQAYRDRTATSPSTEDDVATD